LRESKERLPIVPDDRYAVAFFEVYEAADRALDHRHADQLRAGLEAVVAIAEENPAFAREGLLRLQGDWRALELLEPHVGGAPEQAAMRIGAAIQVARAELASAQPQLRQRVPELMRWLGRPG
jgi:hypothetical protein